MDHGDAASIAELLDERRCLLEVSCRMLDRPGEAESVVEETCRRWYGLPEGTRRRITAPRSWLTNTAGGIRLGRNTPPGRAACVPDDVVGTAPDTLADIVAGTRPECAEHAGPARRRLRMRPSCPATPEEHDALARAVREACVSEDAELLVSLFRPDATAFFDGGGKVRALIGPVHGSRQVAHILLTLLGRRPHTAVLTTHPVNGRTGLVAHYHHQVAAVISLDIADHHIALVRVVLNPDKLRSWNRPSSLAGPPSTPR
ncbi:RNA polymerase subunit sigma [Streptomyces sp. MK5]|uniref:RNA polymerase subunit sigma n=1 Tax=Streptomyces sp. MK5 TaxID=3064253 RepID=UPI00274267B2|nr:RNA polymerase subunit sigma [Streptomyces sp. MK5]